METMSKNSFYNSKLELQEREAKLFAFWAVVTATIAVISAVLVLPILHTSVHNLDSEILQETDFCRLQIRDFWMKWYSIRISVGDHKNIEWVKRAKAQSEKLVRRSKRHWLFGKWISPLGTDNQYSGADDSFNEKYDGELAETNHNDLSSSNGGYDSENINYGLQVSREFNKIHQKTSPNEPYDASPIAASPVFPPSIAPTTVFDQKKPTVVERSLPKCPCQCQYGPPGPAGEPGDNGKDGSDGIPGAPGENGRSGGIIIIQRDSQKEPCIICPPGHAGPPGPQGSRGPPGPRGSNGSQGTHGSQGELGMQGPPGPVGAPGAIGPQGSVGVPGRQFMRDGARGPPGKPGPIGPKGLSGCQGTPGGTVTGPKGAQGDPGRPGHDGHKGIQGPDGAAGAKGASGDCFHCPIPRTPPGY